jgi:hypothetical protein
MDILQNPNFISWFGDSKVVDDAGLPLRCYHVTKAGGFTAFKFSGIGIHFGSKPEQSNKRLDSISRDKGTTNPSMYVCYLRIVKPLYIEDTQSDNEPDTVATIIGDSCKEQNEELSYDLFDLSTQIEKYMEEVYARDTAVQDSSKAIQKCLKSIVTLIQHYGYDGLIYENEWEGPGVSYCVFNPNQIKSALSNKGKYLKTNKNINESNMPLAKWNHIQVLLWLQLIKDRLVNRNDTNAFYAFGKYFNDYNKKTGKILPYSLLKAYISGEINESVDKKSFTEEKRRILYMYNNPNGYLTEAINYDKYKSILSPELFKFLCDIDPTPDKKYSVWIIRCFMKDFRIPQLLDALEVLKKGGNETYEGRSRDPGSNPITYHPLSYGGGEQLGYFYDKKLVRFLQEDYPKVTEDLKKYTKLKNKKLLDEEPNEQFPDPHRLYNIMNFPSFFYLSDVIAEHANELAEIESQEPIDPTEAEKWYEDSQWLVVRPLTMKAACKYGSNTRWCTTYTDPGKNMFNYYNGEGPLIILIEKHPVEVGGTHKYSTPNKWQIHLQSNQWMDAQDEDVGNHADFADKLPKPVSNAIYEHTHAFIFAPDKKKLVTEICSNPEKFAKVKATLAKKSFTSALTDSGIDTLTDVLDDKFYRMAFNDTHWEEVINNDDYSYKYGYDNPWEFLKDQEPALLSKADPCSYCDGTGYAIYVNDCSYVNDWTTELNENQYNTALGNLQSDHPELVDEFIQVYGKKRKDGTYIPLDDTQMEVFAKHIGQECRFCKGTGKEINKEDTEAWSKEQREEAAQESESQAADNSLKEWANDFDSNWNGDYCTSRLGTRRDQTEDTYDKIIKEFLDMESYPEETINTVTNLLCLFSSTEEGISL